MIHKGSQVQATKGEVVPFGWTMVSGKAGDVGILKASDIAVRYGAANLGMFFQSNVEIEIDFTLAYPDFDDQDLAFASTLPWGSKRTVTPSDISAVNFAFTAVRIKFKADGVVYVAAA